MATLKIYNPIMREDEKADYLWLTGADGVCYKDVADFIGAIPEDDNTIDLRLHCAGGSVSEGWAIVDALRATGKKITATIEGDCASMASVILLAASERTAYPHASLLIHHPYIPEYTLADAYKAEDLQKMADYLKAEGAKVLDFYVERTGADREALLAKMDADAPFGMEEAKALGFIHDIVTPASASARGWSAKRFDTMNKDKARKVLADLGQLLGIKAETTIVEAYELTTESGEVLTINKEEGDPEVGDSATPDGEHLMPDGTTIVVVDGVITEIRPAEEVEEENTEENTEEVAEPNPAEEALAQAQARIAELEQALAEAQAQMASEEDKEIVALVNRAGGIAWLKGVGSTHTPQQRSTTVDGDVTKRVSRTQARLEELRKKQNN
jgi:ATP-dependent Clp protease protease subunit